jgi:DNA-binding MarR family transcriptional regulator
MSIEAPTATKPDSVISREELIKLRMTLGRLGRVLRQQNDDGLSYALISLLFNISRTQPVTAGDLASSEGVTPPSVTRSLNRLLQLGLVTRRQDPTDRRASLITLTQAGVAERENVLRRREVWLAAQLARLSPEDLDHLLTALPALERLSDPPMEYRTLA